MASSAADGDVTPRTWAQQAEAVERQNEELNRDQWKLVRDHVHTNIRQISKMSREIEHLKGLLAKLQIDGKEFKEETTSRLDKGLSLLAKDIEEEKSHRVAKLTTVDRQLVAFTDRLNASDAADETARQKTDLAIVSAKKENREKVDAVTERIIALESAVGTQFPQAMNDLKGAIHKLRDSTKEQLDALKEMQETQRAAAADAMAMEQTGREESIKDLQSSITRRLQEEKTSREARDSGLQESLDARFAAEKSDRDAGNRSINELLNVERSKREKAMKAMEDLILSSLAEERNLRDGAHAEFQSALAREKAARDSHRASTQSQLEEERAAREAHAKHIHDLHQAAKDGHAQHLEKQLAEERSLRDASLADLRELVDSHHGNFRDLLDKESVNRASHLDDTISKEKEAREHMLQTMFDKCRAEGDAVLQAKIDAEVATREASIEALKEMLENETASREDDVDELRDIVGAERKAREDHHGEFEARLKEHRDDLENHRDSLHEKMEKERADRHAHHDAHHENVQGLLKAHGDAHGEKHASLMQQIEDLQAQLSNEAEAREAGTAELRKALGVLEYVIGDDCDGSDATRTATTSFRGIASPPPANSEMVPLSKRFQALEAKIRSDIERESLARQAHGDEMRDLIQGEAEKREDYHGSLKEQLATLHGNHGNLQSLLDKERAERASHFETHSNERDAHYSALQDRFAQLDEKHGEHSERHMTFQEIVNQRMTDEIAKLEDLVERENNNILEVTKEVKDQIEAVKRDLSDALAQEGALRDSNEKSIMDVLSRRLEDIEAILDCPDDIQSVAGGIRSPGFVGGGSVASGFAKRVVTLQQRLDGLESRLRGDLTKEAMGRAAERSDLNERLDEEIRSRKDLDTSVRSKFEKERAMIEARMKEDSDSVNREIEALRNGNSKMFNELDQREKALEATVNTETSSLKQSLDEEKSQRMTANNNSERAFVTLKERLSEEEAKNETHRQRFDLALAGQKKESKEKHDMLAERIAVAEQHVHELIPAHVTELRDADHRNYQSMKEQIDSLKSLHETHKLSVSDLIASERTSRDDTVNDLRHHMNTRFAEDKTHRDNRDGLIHDTINTRLREEREERESGMKAANQALAAERTKRESQLASAHDTHAESITDHRRDIDAKHIEIMSLIEREREAREADRAAAQAQRDEAQKAREAHAKEVSRHLDSHRQDHKAALERETSALRSHAKEHTDRLEVVHKSLKGTLDEEVKARDAHINGLKQLLEEEQRARESVINKHKAEHHGLLKEEIDVIRKEVVTSMKASDARSEGGHKDMKNAISEAAKRIASLETCLADKSGSLTLLNLQHELDVLEKKLNADLVKEAGQRESGDAGLRRLIDEEVQARKDSTADITKALQKEETDRNSAITNSTAKFKAALIAKMQLI